MAKRTGDSNLGTDDIFKKQEQKEKKSESERVSRMENSYIDRQEAVNQVSRGKNFQEEKEPITNTTDAFEENRD